jgi:ubiquinone/menaquinone biosynthesis C-methylase UbiE
VTEREELQEQYRTNTNLRARIDLHERFSTSAVSYPRWVFDGYAFGDEADVLELGCGDGNIWRENLDRIPDGWRLILSDLSPGMVEAARGAIGDRAEYVVADVQELPFADGSFDGVIANHMLFHVEDRASALAEIARVLRPAGFSARPRSAWVTCASSASSCPRARAASGKRPASASRWRPRARSWPRSSSTSSSSRTRTRSR